MVVDSNVGDLFINRPPQDGRQCFHTSTFRSSEMWHCIIGWMSPVFLRMRMVSPTESSSTRKIFFVNRLIFEAKGNMILQNIKNNSCSVTMSHPRRQILNMHIHSDLSIKPLYTSYILIYSKNDLKKVMIQPKILTVGSEKIYWYQYRK